MRFDQFFSPQFVEKRKAVRTVLDNVRPHLIPYINACEFPHFIVPELKKLGIGGMDTAKSYGGNAFSNLEMGALSYEFGRTDGSLTAFFLVHNAIGVSTIYNLGGEEQKKRLLP